MNEPPRRVLRVIARLNIGGPAIQAITLTRELEALGYETTLVHGVTGTEEGSMAGLAARLGVASIQLPSLRRDPNPLDDLRALFALVRLIRDTRPAVVHTHAAKAGTLGRLAVLLATGPAARSRPVVVHTYHGHSLTGYFSPRVSAIYRTIEWLLAHVSDRLIAVAPEVRDDLVRLRVARAQRFSVIPLGFDLRPFRVPPGDRAAAAAAVRAELGIGAGAPVVTLIARLVPIKRVDRFLGAAARLAAENPDVRFLIVGDGELGASLRRSEAALALADRLCWTGFRDDIPAVCFASDVVVLTSDNEGTPVSLIEAQAAGVPVVCTRVGGAATVIRDGETGLICERDSAAVAAALGSILADPASASRMGAAGAAHARATFSLQRLTADMAALYRELLG